MKTWSLGRRAAAILLFTPALAFLPGCLGDDESPDAATLNEAENNVSAGAAELALQLDSSLIASIPTWMSQGVEPPPSPLRDGTTSYDEQSQTWVITFSEDYTNEEATGHLESTHRVQFLEDGTPVQFPNDHTNELRVNVEGTNVGNFHPTDAYDVDFDFTLQRAVVVVRDANGLLVSGDGTLGGGTIYHIGNRNYPRQTTLTWGCDLSFAPLSTCAAGTIDGSNGRCTFSATLDGVGNVVWQVTSNGNVVRSGNDHYECTPPGGQ